MESSHSQEGGSQEEVSAQEEYWVPKMPKVLHTLSNKLLPIVAFSDLGYRRCEDQKLREYFEKIRLAASDSRELIIQLRQQFRESQKDTSGHIRPSPGGMQAP